MSPPSLVLVLLFSAAAAAGEPRQLVLNVNQLDASDAPVQEVRVGRASTVINTPWELRARGSGVAGRGEQPFEVLFGRRRAVVTPTRPLVPGERFPFILRLADDTVVPLILAAAPEKEADGEVFISFDFDSTAELRVQLAAARERAQSLESRLRQALQEQESADYELAGLLAGGSVELTALAKVGTDRFKAPGLKIVLDRFTTTSGHAPRKVALVMTLTNESDKPEQISVGALLDEETLQKVPAALRVQPAILPPGATGRVSIVLDPASFGPDGADRLALELGSDAGRVPVELIAKDFRADGSSWWPF